MSTELPLINSLMPLSLFQACLLCSFHAFLFVGSMYVWHAVLPFFYKTNVVQEKLKDRDHPTTIKCSDSIHDILKDRDNPLTIKYRMISAFGSAAISVGVIFAFSDLSFTETFACLGIRAYPSFWTFLFANLFPFFLIIVLFLGPLVALVLDGEAKEQFFKGIDLFFLRAVIICPITEEISFRACMISTLASALSLSPSWVIFFSPLFFGVAHIHHILAGKKVPEVIFQFLYTTLFGWLTSFLFIRSGSLCAVILSHMFCNSMGFPIFDSSHPQKKLIGASWVLGLVGFFGGCWFCMSPELFDNDVYY